MYIIEQNPFPRPNPGSATGSWYLFFLFCLLKMLGHHLMLMLWQANKTNRKIKGVNVIYPVNPPPLKWRT